MLTQLLRLSTRSVSGAQRSFSRAVLLQRADSGDSAAAKSPELAATFKKIEGLMSEDLVKSIGGRYQFDLKGIEPWQRELMTGSYCISKCVTTR